MILLPEGAGVARWTGHDEIATVLEAAAAWRDRCLLQDGSLLTDQPLWTLANLEALHALFSGNPIEGGEQTFYEKLAEQLQPAPPELKKLAAEAIWLTLLFNNGTKPETKRQRVQEMWAKSDEALVATTPYLEDPYITGVGGAGVAYMTGLPNEFGFALEVAIAFKKRPPAERIIGNTDADAWLFAEWLDALPGATARPMRNALLYFLFPDQFERNLSSGHRSDMYVALKGTLPLASRPAGAEPSLLDLDKAIYAIRRLLEQRLGSQELDFYRDPLAKMWGNDKREARRKQVAAALEATLNNYNLEVHQPGSKKKLLQNTRPTSETTGYWQDPNDATNKPLRWLLHLDIRGDEPVASTPAQHGSRRIAFLNTAQGKSGAALVRIVPAMQVADDRFEFFETWEWLLMLCFLPNLPKGTAAQLLDDFDPETGVLTYMGNPQPYIAAGLVGLNDPDATYTTEVGGVVKTITYGSATAALSAFLHVEVAQQLAEQPAAQPMEQPEGQGADNA